MEVKVQSQVLDQVVLVLFPRESVAMRAENAMMGLLHRRSCWWRYLGALAALAAVVARHDGGQHFTKEVAAVQGGGRRWKSRGSRQGIGAQQGHKVRLQCISHIV
jgi:hypothetical protein